MKIVCFGDSLTTCGGEGGRYSDILTERFPAHIWINKGVGGETFQDALQRVDEDVLQLQPDIVLLEFGANDWWRDERPWQDWLADLEKLILLIQNAGAQVVILGVFGDYRDQEGSWRAKHYGTDGRALLFRQAEEELARCRKCFYLPNMQAEIIENRCCWRDRNHPNEYGNRYVADLIEPVIEKLTQTKALPIRKPILRTLADFWQEAVELAPNRLAVVDRERRLTYAEADDLITQLACGIRNAVSSERPKIAVFLPNCLEYYLIYWAVAKLGGVVVPLNTWLKRESLQAIFENVRPDLLILESAGNEDVVLAAAALPDMPQFSLETDPGSARSFSSLLKNSAEEVDSKLAAPDDAAIVMHTSGTTALPKGAIMRHSDLIFNVMTTINAHQFSPDDVHLLVNPMFHCTALYSSLPTAAYQKSPVIITAETTPDVLMRLVQEEKITTILSTPTVLQRITAMPGLAGYDYRSLRLMAYAGSMMPVSTVRQLQKLFPEVELHNFFGLTETISMTHVLSGEDALERPDSIGRLLPFVEAIVVDENGLKAGPGEIGELFFARENVIPGYYNQKGKLEESLVEIDGRRWFRTGDLAVADEEGYFFIKGRKKDMIIVGGENVFAAEIEGLLMTHDGVKEAAVKGIPATGVRESLGELIKAYIVRANERLNEQDVRRHCHRRLPSYKIPHIIQFVDALPRNPAGKVMKAQLP